jgi:hypothetical protein
MLIVAPIMRSLGGMMGGGGMGGGLGLSLTALGGLFADGGEVRGPGTGRSDSIPIRVSNGEYIVNATSTAKHRAALEAINSDRIPRFANGGAVGNVPTFAGAGSQTTIAPAISIKVEGGSRGAAADEALAKNIGAHVDQSVRKVVAEEMQRQMKPGGILRH